MLMPGCIDQRWRHRRLIRGRATRLLLGPPSAEPPPAAQDGVQQPGTMGRWGRRLGPPPKRHCGAHFRCRAWVGCLKGRRLWVLGRAKLGIQTRGGWGGDSWPLPLPADRSLQHHMQRRRAERWLQHLLERRQKQLSITSPALTPPAAEGRIIRHEAAASGPLLAAPQDTPPTTISLVPMVPRPAFPCSCLQTLPVPAQPTRSRSGWLLCLRRANLGPRKRGRSSRAAGGWCGGVVSGAWEPTRCQARGGRRCETAADGRRCRPWHEGAAALPPSPGGGRDWGGGSLHPELCLPCDWERAIPTQNKPGDRICPCRLQPELPRDLENQQSSWVMDASGVPAAAMARQQWKRAKKMWF